MEEKNEARYLQKKLRASDIALIILTAIAVILIVLRLIGVRIYAVVSPSMESTLSVGDLTVVVPKNCDRIESGEIIVFVEESSGETAIHRVISKDEEGQSFVTQGDHNDAADEAAVSYDSVVGVVKLVIPGTGNAAVFLSSTQGKVMLALLFSVFVVSVLLVGFYRRQKRSRTEEESEE